MTWGSEPQSCIFQRHLVGHRSHMFNGYISVHLGAWSIWAPPLNSKVIPSVLYVKFQRPGSQRQACRSRQQAVDMVGALQGSMALRGGLEGWRILGTERH